MTKRLDLTEDVKNLIRASVGDDIDFSKIAAYEAEVASTRPISQRHTAYHGARLSERYLEQMSEYLESETVPLQVMHNSSVLPVGKVFSAKSFENQNGEISLNALFYVEENSPYASQIDLGIVDEVSIGASPSHALCSECGFDYAEAGNEMAFLYQECDEGHRIGEEGVHLRVTGLDQWKELSLVNKGASSKPKILGSAKRRLSASEYNKLAASNGQSLSFEMKYLTCNESSFTNPNDKEESKMDLSTLTNEVKDLSAAKAKIEVKLETTESQLSAANESLTAANEKVQALETQVAELSNQDQEKQVAELTSQLAETKGTEDFLRGQYELACKATATEINPEASAKDMIEALKTAQVKLAAIPRNGATLSADSGSDFEKYKDQVSANLAFVN